MALSFLLDLGRCIGCEACVAACKTGNELPEGRTFISITPWTRGTFPDLEGGFGNHRCYHCTDAACVTVCPTAALFKEDGLTRLHRDKCTGCGYCVESCPYGIPEISDGRLSKCDGCEATVAAGGEPWCVQTCPSDALRYGLRDEILAEARTRVEALKGRYPNAQIYGETQAGGLGLVVVSPEDPATYGLPMAPETPALTTLWTGAVQPATLVLTAGATVAAGVMGIIARRNHMAEMREIEALERAEAAAPADATGEDGES